MTRGECRAMNFARPNWIDSRKIALMHAIDCNCMSPFQVCRDGGKRGEPSRPTRGGRGDGKWGDDIGEFGAMNLCATVRRT